MGYLYEACDQISEKNTTKNGHIQNVCSMCILEAHHWAEPLSLTFHSALRKLNTEPSIGASHQISAHFGQKKIFRNQPI